MEMNCQDESSAALSCSQPSISSCSLQLSFSRDRDDRTVFHTCQLAVSGAPPPVGVAALQTAALLHGVSGEIKSDSHATMTQLTVFVFGLADAW